MKHLKDYKTFEKKKLKIVRLSQEEAKKEEEKEINDIPPGPVTGIKTDNQL